MSECIGKTTDAELEKNDWDPVLLLLHVQAVLQGDAGRVSFGHVVPIEHVGPVVFVNAANEALDVPQCDFGAQGAL